MKSKTRNLLFSALLIAILSAVGAVVGRLAGPSLSRMDYKVQVAERVYEEESKGLDEQTDQSEAFRVLGVPSETLYADAREVRQKYKTGGTWLGIWLGLVLALKIITIRKERGRREYETDSAHCMACGRCYLSCPIERKRLNTQD